MKQRTSTWRTILRVVPMVYRASPLFFCFFIIVAALHGLSWGVTVTATQFVFDTLEGIMQREQPIAGVLGPLLLMAAITILTQIVNALHSFVYTPLNQHTIGYFSQKIQEKAGKQSLLSYEDSQFLDQINKANEGVNHVFNLAFSVIMVFAFFMPYILYMAVYLFVINSALPVILIALAVPLLVVQELKSKLFAGMEDQSAPYRRKMDHYQA
jgi:ATP-binding cassette subfamily B protein